uniref:Ras association domain family member 7a n=1 Tax=Oryzias sinensis TaxID=183150 RepID=A0A8C7WVF0_9TELE
MELKVWVDGAVRVVCGLSEETSCQDVVIALAQAIGQTGRYVLIQRLRDTERQLLATERPLESLAKLGQHGGEVQFFLRRTGPSSSDGCSSKNDKTAPNSLPKHPEPEPLKRNQPKKALTFNLGPSTSPKSTPKQVSRSPRDSPEQRSSPSPHPESPHGTKPGHSPSVRPSKNEVFKKVLQQQERLRAIEVQLESVEKDSHTWKRSYPSPKKCKKKQDELAFEKYWEDELQSEVEKDQEMRHKLGQLQAKLDDCGRQLHELSVRSAQLEKEVQQESQAKDKSHGPQDTVEAVKAKLRSQEKRVIELGEQLSETEKALGKAESVLQAKNEEVEELNKELRQCNLQQFIQQTGVLPSQALDPLSKDICLHLPGQSVTPGESPPRPTAKQFLGHPRNLQNPLVSSLNPEVLTSQESSWR